MSKPLKETVTLRSGVTMQVEIDCEFSADNEEECFCTSFTVHYLSGDKWVELTEEDFTKEEWGKIEDLVDAEARDQDAHDMYYMQQIDSAEALEDR